MRLKTGLIFIILGLFVAIVASPVLAAGYNYIDTTGDPVAVIGKDEFLITNGELLTGKTLIEGLGLKVVDANGNDLGLPEELVFGFGEDKHSADEEAEIINNFFIDKDYENGGISVYVSFNRASQYYSGFRTLVTNIDNSNIIYPVEDPYRDVVCAIIGQSTLYIPYGTEITGDMIVDNMKVVDADGNDLGLSDRIIFKRTIGIGNTFEITADEFADYINKHFAMSPTELDSLGFNNFYVCLEGPATYFDFRFNVVRYEDRDFVAGEPYAIVSDLAKETIFNKYDILEIPLDTSNNLILNEATLFGGLKVVDIEGNVLDMNDQLVLYPCDSLEDSKEYMNISYQKFGGLNIIFMVTLKNYPPIIQREIYYTMGDVENDPLDSDDNENISDDEGVVVITGNINYTTHVQNEGWQSSVDDGDMSGTEGKSLRLEGIKIETGIDGLGVEYATHVQNKGWQGFVADGSMSGTKGESLRLEAIKIQLTGEQAENYDVYYRVHAQNVGWMGWAKNGESAGTAGFGYRLEGIEIQIVEKGADPPGITNNSFMES